jgi:hypothetical protein
MHSASGTNDAALWLDDVRQERFVGPVGIEPTTKRL